MKWKAEPVVRGSRPLVSSSTARVSSWTRGICKSEFRSLTRPTVCNYSTCPPGYVTINPNDILVESLFESTIVSSHKNTHANDDLVCFVTVATTLPCRVVQKHESEYIMIYIYITLAISREYYIYTLIRNR